MNHIGRKFYHLVGGVGLLSLYYVLGKNQALLTYAILFIVVLVLDVARLNLPSLNRFVYTRFGGIIRNNEKQKLTGTAPYILGIGLSLYAFSAAIASAAICFLAFGDVAATTIGERYGKTKIGAKSLEGTAAFIAAGLFAGLVLLPAAGAHVPTGIIAAGAVIAAAVELIPLANDNLTIPIVSGAAMTLLMRWFS
jgi:diacylglycerol kinase (CTP)